MNKDMLGLLSLYGAVLASSELHNTTPTFSRGSPLLKHQVKRRKAAKLAKLARKKKRR